MSTVKVENPDRADAGGLAPDGVDPLDHANFDLTSCPAALAGHLHQLRREYFKSDPEGDEPIAAFLGQKALDSLNIDLANRPNGVPEIKSEAELAEYYRQPTAKKPFFYVSEQIAGKVKCEPSPEPLVNLQEAALAHGIDIIVAPVESRFNGAIYLRQHVSQDVLRGANVILNATGGEITLKIYDGYRALEDQRRLFEHYKLEFEAAMPGASAAEVWERLTQVVADPDLTPPHSTGGALDLTLAWTKNHVELDMGSGVNQLNAKAATWCRDLSPAQEYNRLLLLGTMNSVGFFNLPTEFWHFSKGDPYEALYSGSAHARYASIVNLNMHAVICSRFRSDGASKLSGANQHGSG